MLYYQTLGMVPDFAQPPGSGAVTTPSIIEGAPAARIVRWIEQTSEKRGQATYVLRGPLELQAFRDFAWAHRASWKPCYWPSWTEDWSSDTVVAIGTVAIDIDQDLAAFLVDDLPDTHGRTIYVYTESRELYVGRILTSTSNGDGTYELVLDTPFEFAADLAGALCGFTWLVKFEEDAMTYKMSAPDAATIKVGLRTVTNYVGTEGTSSLPEATVPSSESLPFDNLVETDEAMPVTNMRASACYGPEVFNVAQGESFTHEWAASIDATGDTVVITDGVVSPITSEFSVPSETRHISMAFDSLSNEALAYQTGDFNTSRIYWHSGAGTAVLDFPGRTPILFNNFSVNGTASGGDCEIHCFYLKTNEAKLFCRLQSTSFATEYVWCRLPVMALGLLGANIADNRMILTAISVRHTLLTLTSDPYPQVVPLQTDGLSGEATLEGAYDSTIVEAEEDEGGGTTTGTTTIEGAYVSSIIDGSTGEGEGEDGTGGATGDTTIAGLYVNSVVDETGVDNLTGGATITGAYSLRAIEGSRSDSATGEATISGTYAVL